MYIVQHSIVSVGMKADVNGEAITKAGYKSRQVVRWAWNSLGRITPLPRPILHPPHQIRSKVTNFQHPPILDNKMQMLSLSGV